MKNTLEKTMQKSEITKELEQGLEEQKKILEKLKILTNSLPDMRYFVINSQPGKIELNTIGGTCVGENLLNIGKIAVAKWTAKKGAFLELHSLKEREWVIVYEGKMKVSSFDEKGNIVKEEELNPSDYCFWEANVPHESLFLEDTLFIAVTIPASEGWPKSDN